MLARAVVSKWKEEEGELKLDPPAKANDSLFQALRIDNVTSCGRSEIID
jgi:hypothetical protein